MNINYLGGLGLIPPYVITVIHLLKHYYPNKLNSLDIYYKA